MPWFVAEVRGYSRAYDRWDEYGLWYLILSVPLFLVFTDACIYWVHRIEHHPLLYKHVHKPHHKWIVPTPFASHAFHPLDGYAQSLPYHIFPCIFPLNKLLFLCLFGFVNLWSIMIHDSDMINNTGFEKYINGPAHHRSITYTSRVTMVNTLPPAIVCLAVSASHRQRMILCSRPKACLDRPRTSRRNDRCVRLFLCNFFPRSMVGYHPCPHST